MTLRDADMTNRTTAPLSGEEASKHITQREGEKLDAAAFKALIRAAIAANVAARAARAGARK